MRLSDTANFRQTVVTQTETQKAQKTSSTWQDTSWQNTFRIPSNENKTLVMQSSFFTLKLLDGIVHFLLAAEH